MSESTETNTEKTTDKKDDLVLRHSTLVQRLVFNLYLFMATQLKGFKSWMISILERLRDGLSEETEQTKEMLEIYVRQTQGRATSEEISRANHQLRDVLRSLGLGVVLVLSFSPITLPLIVRLGRRLGVEVLPDSFRKKTRVP